MNISLFSMFRDQHVIRIHNQLWVNEQLIMDGNLIDYALNDNPLSLPFSPINDPTNVHSYIYVFCLV